MLAIWNKQPSNNLGIHMSIQLCHLSRSGTSLTYLCRQDYKKYVSGKNQNIYVSWSANVKSVCMKPAIVFLIIVVSKIVYHSLLWETICAFNTSQEKSAKLEWVYCISNILHSTAMQWVVTSHCSRALMPKNLARSHLCSQSKK